MTNVAEDFVIARNPEPGSTLPYLLRIPLGEGILLKAKDTSSALALTPSVADLCPMTPHVKCVVLLEEVA